MAELAKSIFTRTADEETVVEDVYKKLQDGVVNSYQDLQGFASDLTEKFSFLSSSASGQLLKDTLDGGVELDLKSVTERVTGAFSEDFTKAKTLVSDLASKANSVATTIKGTVNTVTGIVRKAQHAYQTVNGIVSTIKNADLTDLRSITNTLNAVAGQTSVALSANGALGSIYGSLVSEASAKGIQDAFGIVADSIKASTQLVNKGQILYETATTALPGAIARGDIKSVASIVDHLGSGAVSMMNPNAVQQIARTDKVAYTPNEITGTSSNPGQFYEYQGAYQKIDPNWNTTSWRPISTNETFQDLTSLLDASKQVRDVFRIGGVTSDNLKDRIFGTIDAFNGLKSVDSAIKERYPMRVINNDNAVTERDVNPRLNSFEATQSFLL